MCASWIYPLLPLALIWVFLILGINTTFCLVRPFLRLVGKELTDYFSTNSRTDDSECVCVCVCVPCGCHGNGVLPMAVFISVAISSLLCSMSSTSFSPIWALRHVLEGGREGRWEGGKWKASKMSCRCPSTQARIHCHLHTLLAQVLIVVQTVIPLSKPIHKGNGNPSPLTSARLTQPLEGQRISE